MHAAQQLAVALVLAVSVPAHSLYDRLPNIDICTSELARQQSSSYRRAWLGVASITTFFASVPTVKTASTEGPHGGLAALTMIPAAVGLVSSLGWDDDIRVCSEVQSGASSENVAPAPYRRKPRVFTEFANYDELYEDQRRDYIYVQSMLGVLAGVSGAMIPLSPGSKKVAASILTGIPLGFMAANYFEMKRKRRFFGDGQIHSWHLMILPQHNAGVSASLSLRFD